MRAITWYAMGVGRSVCRSEVAAGLSRDPEEPAAHVSDYLALLPSGPDAVHRLRLHRVRAALRPVTTLAVGTPPIT